jgi:molybdopterin converting factor small subunit
MTVVSISLLFFAVVKERLGGRNSHQVTLPKNRWNSSQELIDFLCSDILPEISEFKTFLALAVNEEYRISGEVILQDQDRVALIPPITGG